MSIDSSTATTAGVPVSSPSSDAFTRERWAWLKQVVADSDLTPFSFRVAFVVADHLNRESRLSWPSQDRMAQVLGATRKGIQGALIQLAERGHVAVLPPMNRKQGNRYRPILMGLIEVDAVEHIPDRSHEAVSHVTDGAHETGSHANDGAHEVPPHDTGRTHEIVSHDTSSTHEESCHATHRSTVMPLAGGPNLLNEPTEIGSESIPFEPKPRRAAPKPKAKTSDADFEAWWTQCPKKEGKGPARRAYDKVILSGAATHAELVAGMMRYAATRVGQDSKYTKTPGPWLNDERWKDISAPAQRYAAAGRQGSNLFDALQEIIDADTDHPRTGRRDHVADAFDDIIDVARQSQYQTSDRPDSTSRHMDMASSFQGRTRPMSPTAAAFASFLTPDRSTEGEE